MTKITVVAVDDHYLIRAGIRGLLAEQADISLLGEGSAGEHVLPLVERHQPDILLLDLGLPQHEGASVRMPGTQFRAFPTILRLGKRFPHTRVIVISQYDNQALIEGAVQAGVKGYLLKDDALTRNLVEAIRLVHHGSIFFSEEIIQKLADKATRPSPTPLKERQMEILQIIAAHPDHSHLQHARQLAISENTLKQHLGRIYRALGVSNLTAAVIRATQLGILPSTWMEDGQTLLHDGDAGETNQEEKQSGR